MSKYIPVAWLASALVASWATPAAAQNAVQEQGAAASQRQSRYQVGVMERVLEGAVEHGATIIRDKLQAVAPAQMVMLDNARVRGFRLEGYGVFFDVIVPSFEGTLFWSLRTLDQNNLGLESALNKLKTHVERAGDVDLQQALRRLELQIGPVAAGARAASTTAPTTAPAAVAGFHIATDSAATADSLAKASNDVLADPEEAYRTEVMQALAAAMLDYSGPLSIGSDEWLTIAARRNEERARLAPADSDARTFVIRTRGADLNAFRAGQLSRDEALKRIELRVF